MSGPAGWAESQLIVLLKQAAAEFAPDVLWVGAQAPAGFTRVSPQPIAHLLGREARVLVFDARESLHPDVLAASAGVLRGGGELVLLLPSDPMQMAPAERLLAYGQVSADVGHRFMARLLAQLDAPWIDHDRMDECQSDQQNQPVKPLRLAAPAENFQLLDAQQQFAEQLAERSIEYQPLLLTADRGRGKSTALGEGVVRALEQGIASVLISAPSRAAVNSLFARIEARLPQAKWQGDVLHCEHGEVRWLPLQRLLEEQPETPCLIVDEAASVAGQVLRRLVERYPRLVLSSTVHGYEGSGRGFLLRFKHWLAANYPQAEHVQLAQPVRWAEDDPLEAWLNHALLLDVEAPTLHAPSRQLSVSRLDQAALADDEARLQQVFALLVSAHYQTRPSDLQQLLDAPGLQSWVVCDGAQDGAVVGVLLAVEEGGFSPELAQAVCAGERRPRGHLLLQSLAQHAGLCEAPSLRALRVMRIAVQADCRRAGVGQLLLTALREHALARSVDVLGTSFGVQSALLPFWQAADFVPVRLGHKPDPASGTYALQMLSPVTDAGQRLVDKATARFAAAADEDARLHALLAAE